jgi:hypothetical protein
LDVLDIVDLAYLINGQDLVGVCFDAMLGDDVPQELAPGEPECALFWVQLDVDAPEVSEGFFQVSDETTTLLGLHDDVVTIDLQVVHDFPFETRLLLMFLMLLRKHTELSM